MFNKFLPIITSFLIFFFLETFFFYPKSIYINLILVNLLFFFFIKKLLKLKVKKRWLSYLTLPSFFTLGIVAYSTMIPNEIIIQFLFALNILFIYLYFKTLYLFFYKKLENKFSSIENIFSFGNFLSFFFLSSSLYGLYSHLSIPIVIILVVMLVIFALLVYNIIFILKLKNKTIENKNIIIYIIIFCVILIELASTVSFLPFNHKITGLILSICYYMLVGLAKYYLFLGTIEMKKIKLYLGFGFSAIFFILVTAKWL